MDAVVKPTQQYLFSNRVAITHRRETCRFPKEACDVRQTRLETRRVPISTRPPQLIVPLESIKRPVVPPEDSRTDFRHGKARCGIRNEFNVSVQVQDIAAAGYVGKVLDRGGDMVPHNWNRANGCAWNRRIADIGDQESFNTLS